MYCGRNRNPQKLQEAVQEAVQEVDEPYAALKEEVFVAGHIKDPKKIPVIGKVTVVGEDTISIEYMIGFWRKA